jgi:hypothetical protein
MKMFNLTVGEDTYRVGFWYGSHMDLVSEMDESNNTYCSIQKNDVSLADGYSVCHVGDQYNKNKGRKQALTNTLIKERSHFDTELRKKVETTYVLPKEIRDLLWKKYWSMSSVKKVS